tara:strand:+ start:1284 stop:1523 length:240 start_codon:yes stop_codon:yes gene_type:complete
MEHFEGNIEFIKLSPKLVGIGLILNTKYQVFYDVGREQYILDPNPHMWEVDTMPIPKNVMRVLYDNGYIKILGQITAKQ